MIVASCLVETALRVIFERRHVYTHIYTYDIHIFLWKYCSEVASLLGNNSHQLTLFPCRKLWWQDQSNWPNKLSCQVEIELLRLKRKLRIQNRTLEQLEILKTVEKIIFCTCLWFVYEERVRKYYRDDAVILVKSLKNMQVITICGKLLW